MQKAAPQSCCQHQYTLILTEVVVSNFRKPSPQKSFGIPPKAQASKAGVRIPIDPRKRVGGAGSQFRYDANSGIINFNARERNPVPKYLFKGGALTGLAPFD